MANSVYSTSRDGAALGDSADTAMSTRSPARANVRDSLSANTYFSAWPAAQGRFHARPRVRQVARQLDIALQTILLCDRLRREHDEAPIWVRVGRTPALFLIHRDDISSVLYGGPEPFTGDTGDKHAAMSQFQPGALALCRGDQWRRVRAMVDDVLDQAAADPAHIASARSVVTDLLDRTGEIDFQTWLATHRRLARQIVLGDLAAGDPAITDLLAAMTASANRVTGRPDPTVPTFNVMIAGYLKTPQPGTIAAALVDRETPQTPAAPQIAHLLTKLGDTTALATFHALQLLSARPATCSGPVYTAAAIREATRLWPAATVLSRESTRETIWGEERVPVGTRFVIVNTFGHRDRRRIEFADEFLPSEWLDGGSAIDEILFNGFGHGPQDCPGEELALACGAAMLSEVVETADIEPPSGVLADDGRVVYSPPPLNPLKLI